MKSISVHAFNQLLKNKSTDEIAFINVCTPAEYKEKHIEGVKNLPLDEIELRVGELADKKTIYIHCRSGNRSQKAVQKLHELGVKAELVNVDGGLLAWEEGNLPTRSLGKSLPIIRQVMIVAGSLVLSGVVLGVFVNVNFLILSGFVGAGLVFAGVSGWCGMAFLLAKMPWNKK